MAIEFNGSKKNREMEALDLLLKGKSDEYKGRVYDYVRNAKVDANDPTFLLMAALGNLDVALVDLPKAIEANGKKSSAEISKLITELRTMFQLAAKQAQERIDAINDAEGRIQQQLDTVSVKMTETLATLKKYRDESSKVLEFSRDNYQKLVEENYTRHQQLLSKTEKLGQQLEAERQLRMSKPWKNAVNLPPLMLVAVIVLPLMIGLLIGSNFTNKESANIDRLRYQIYDTFKKPQEDAAKELLIKENNKKSRKNRG
jgi:vacuolar-type H+-ATPase subunit I/STV1